MERIRQARGILPQIKARGRQGRDHFEICVHKACCLQGLRKRDREDCRQDREGCKQSVKRLLQRAHPRAGGVLCGNCHKRREEPA